MKKIISLILCISLMCLCFAGCNSNDNNSATPSGSKYVGTIKLELYPEIAPITVENFTMLVESGFYNGLTFHRIIEGFMMQGGDPLGTGLGGADKDIYGEFSVNGWENNLSHTRGVISMARSQDYNSASSQFFIMHKDYPGLDGQYAAFGRVTEGMNIVDTICRNVVTFDSNGSVYEDGRPYIVSAEVVEESADSVIVTLKINYSAVMK